ncbi:MAG TPA: hypothetical protein VFR86_15320 [Burkholderiaceae bacterium]|nr:hypothetical protein [Burkholderiaceae bacterium]
MQVAQSFRTEEQVVRRRRASPGRRERRTPAQWTELIAQQRASGLSERQFCMEHGIGLSTLGNQRRKLERAAAKGPRANPRQPSFLPIPVRGAANGPAPIGGDTPAAEIMIGDAVRIRLHGAALDTLLGALLARIGASR